MPRAATADPNNRAKAPGRGVARAKELFGAAPTMIQGGAIKAEDRPELKEQAQAAVGR